MICHRLALRAALAAAALALAACASGPRLAGAVTPQPGGQLQSIVKGADRTQAMRKFDNDAKAYCGETGAIPALDKPGKYVVVSQNVVDKHGDKPNTGDSRIDAGVTAGMRYLGLAKEDSVEVTTIFKCEK
ncbi:MAG: hypothetical protein JNL30_14535 [Rubrivivax sp.]|nr:hypothetical protein [Rubrivivax sp.]